MSETSLILEITMMMHRFRSFCATLIESRRHTSSVKGLLSVYQISFNLGPCWGRSPWPCRVWNIYPLKNDCLVLVDFIASWFLVCAACLKSNSKVKIQRVCFPFAAYFQRFLVTDWNDPGLLHVMSGNFHSTAIEATYHLHCITRIFLNSTP